MNETMFGVYVHKLNDFGDPLKLGTGVKLKETSRKEKKSIELKVKMQITNLNQSQNNLRELLERIFQFETLLSE